MKRRTCRTVFVPLLLPRLSDHAAAQLLDIFGQLHDCLRHHYAEQAWRWQRQQIQQEESRCQTPLFRLEDRDVPF